ncbi:hypothetical protein [Streptomyces sp. NPDC050534]|uniref:hypothetical protein n=1 Tax=Streptomyces sp. NPDC050534 TaxID=3365625 RepID=UPI0037970FF3
MKIRMKADVSGSRDGEPWPPRGGTLVLPDEEGAALCASGIAEPVSDDKVEKAVPDDDSEKRGAPKEETSEAQDEEKQAAPAKKAPAKRAPAKPQGDSK